MSGVAKLPSLLVPKLCWERPGTPGLAKLCFANSERLKRFAKIRASKQSFEAVRSQAELGNEGKRMIASRIDSNFEPDSCFGSRTSDLLQDSRP